MTLLYMCGVGALLVQYALSEAGSELPACLTYAEAKEQRMCQASFESGKTSMTMTICF
jgi:hypothetical protein